MIPSRIMPPCPICKGTVAARGDNAAFPFCSSRCKQVDLGQWLGEKYGVPVRAPEFGDEPGSVTESPPREDP